MEIYLTTMFWLGCLSVIMRVFFVVGDHPRRTSTSLGLDVIGLLLSIAMLIWVALLKYGIPCMFGYGK